MNKQIKALKLAIKALEKQRRQHSAGHVAFHQGIDFTFAIQAEKNWHECDNAISQLADLIEILEEANAEAIQNKNLHTADDDRHSERRGTRQHRDRERASVAGTDQRARPLPSRQSLLPGFDNHSKPDKGAQ